MPDFTDFDDNAINTNSKMLEKKLFPWSEKDELSAFIADEAEAEAEAEADRYSNDWES